MTIAVSADPQPGLVCISAAGLLVMLMVMAAAVMLTAAPSCVIASIPLMGALGALICLLHGIHAFQNEDVPQERQDSETSSREVGT